jgi:FtsH-binding integral membrane protein
MEEDKNKNKKENALNIIPDLNGDKDRQMFVIKTYTLITIMLCFTVGLTSAFRFHKSIQFWIFSNIWLYYLCMAIVIIISFSILCFYK